MSEREKTPDITSELNALADQVQQDREAGVFLGKGQPPIVSELSRQLRASIRFDAINGTATERAICGSQMIRAADRLDHLEAENARLRTKNSEWHRRVQAADKAVHDAERCVQEITEGANQGTPWVGGSFGRALLAYGCKRRDDEITSLRTELAAMPQWRDKPTCPGQWLCRWCETELAVSTINAIDIELWHETYERVFGPIPTDTPKETGE